MMKKVFVLVISIVLMLSLALSVSAATPAAALNAEKDQVAVDQTVVVKLALADIEAATSMKVDVAHGTAVELVSAKWLKDGTIADFTGKSGVIALKSGADVNGDVLELIFKGKTPAADKEVISVNVVVKNSDKEVLKKSVTKELWVICAEHSFGEWTETKAPTCAEVGEEVRDCSVCALKETREVKKLAHKYGEYTVTKEATCDEAGTETKTCSECGKKSSREIAMLEHTYGEWVVVEEATEEMPGKQTKTCSGCGNVIEEVIPVKEPAPTQPETTPTQPTDTQAPTQPAPAPAQNNNAMMWIVIAAIAAVCVIVVVLIIVKKKK